MNIAWKEIKKNKVRFLILGTIVFLVSLLTFIVSGLANGLSHDNAALIKDLPNGQFYMAKEAKQNYNLSRIDKNTQENILNKQKDAVAISIQMGFYKDSAGKQRSAAFVTSTESKLFPSVKKGEIVLDDSLKDEGIKAGDALTNQNNGKFIVRGFASESTYSHAPVAMINIGDFKNMYQVNDMQLIFIPGEETHSIAGLQSFTKNQFLNTISSYKAEQMSLNMIIWFLIVISGMLFAIFFYMMNVQKMGLYGILKAMGIKTGKLFTMMYTQMFLITGGALIMSILLCQVFNLINSKGIPYSLTFETTVRLSAVFFIISFIGATLSGIQMKKIEPLQAIQQGEV